MSTEQTQETEKVKKTTDELTVELNDMNLRLYEIAETFDPKEDSTVVYNLLTAFDRVVDAIAELEENDKYHQED